MKIQHRIALMFVGLTVGIVLLLSGLEYFLANQNSFEDFYKRLEIRAILAAKIKFEQEEMGQNLFEEMRRQHLETLPDEREYVLPAKNTDSAAAALSLPVPGSFFSAAQRDGFARYRSHNMFYLGYHYVSKKDNYIIVLAAKNEFIDAYLNNLRRIILISVLGTAIIAAVIGLWFSKLILQPVRTITRKMQDITATQLHLRINTGKGTDEIATLSHTFNNMLDRLEATFETHKNFISNASHELNTPLTTIIGESEFALSRSRSSEEYANSMAAILHEAERLRKITNSLLQLAQTGYNGKAQEFTKLRIDEVIYEVKQIVDNMLPGNKVFINLGLMPEDEDKLVIKGNLPLLELAFSNIITNGCKYSDNQQVDVTIAATARNVVVIIEDRGIGIPSSEIAYIYDPFFRASNTGKFHGYGIGLPLARNIIRMHNGQLDVTSEENVGTKIKITFPAA